MRCLSSALFTTCLLLGVAGCSSIPQVQRADVIRTLPERSVAVGSRRWTFEPQEPLTVFLLDRRRDGYDSEVVAGILTEGFLLHEQMQGNLRLQFRWNGDQWELERIENISFQQLVIDGSDN